MHDFFRDTGMGAKGYTIVEQGHIAEIVSAKPEDRRELIEEAAGIGKYKARRREAESKIGSTEQNLLRVTDVLAEIRRQITRIERQAKKAARYKRLRETWRVLELSLAADDRARAIGGGRGRARAAARRCCEQVTGLETRLAERELALEQRAPRAGGVRARALAGHRGAAGAAQRDQGLRGTHRVRPPRARESRGHDRARGARSSASCARSSPPRRARPRSAGSELRAVEAAVESEREAVARAETAARSAREELQALERERESASAALVEVLTSIARAEDRLAAVDDRRAAIDARLRSADESLEVGQVEASRADHEQRALEEGLRNLLSERDRLMGALRAALEGHEQAVARGAPRRASRCASDARRARRGARASPRCARCWSGARTSAPARVPCWPATMARAAPSACAGWCATCSRSIARRSAPSRRCSRSAPRRS